MVPPAPRLSHQDLEAELDRFHADNHRSLHTAFFGTGEPGQVTVKVRGELLRFEVVRADCELRLRDALARAEEGGVPVALLVDYTTRLPLDVEGRLARGGLMFVSRERRLANLFGARAVAPALLEGALSDALLREGRPFSRRLEGQTVDEHTAWRMQLERMTGLDSTLDLSEERVIDHFAREPAREGLARERAAHAKLFEAAGAFLKRAVGPVAALAFAAWLDGRGGEVAALSFVIDPLADKVHEGYVKGFLRVELRSFDSALALDPTLLGRWRSLVPALALKLDQAPSVLDRVLAEADARVAGHEDLQPHLATSRYLPSGFEAAKQELARALDAAIAQAGADGRGRVQPESVRAAVDAFAQLKQHRLADAPAHLATKERALMAVRLLAYLHARGQWEAQLRDRALIEVAYELAEHYASEGGFVDFARRAARGGDGTDGSLGAALSRVLAAVDAVRDAQDARFAPALARWNTERKLGRLLPIEHALGALGLEFVTAAEHRKLLILVMDGMAWSTAVEILLDVSEVQYGPLRWTPPRFGAARVVPMIAALPTMTEVSRAALFAGKLPRVGEKLNTLRDPERLAEHGAFVKAFGQGPRLLLRNSAEDNAGHLTPEARELVRSPDRVVALVLNAVDDMLGAKPSYRGFYNRETIKALGPVLDEARDAGRAVLLLGDHGHVLSDRERNRVEVQDADSPRYREVEDGAPVDERELVLPADDAHAYRTRGGKRLALLFREADRYRDVHHLGEHGGASLSEVVAPALLIGAEELQQRVAWDGDEGLETVALAVPPWWHLELPSQRKPSARPAERPGRKSDAPKKKASDSQLVIEAVAAPKPAPPPRAAAAERCEWSKRVDAAYAREPKARRERLHKHVLPVLDLLFEHDGRMSDEVLAGQRGEALRNVGGLVATMAEYLNLDGYEVVRHDLAAKQVELDAALLLELFGDDA